MCGIYGIVPHQKTSFTAEYIKNVYIELMLLSESRGKEASGIALHDGAEIHVYKTPFRGSQLQHDPQFKSVLNKVSDQKKPLCIMGHSRLATNGHQLENHNNQPVLLPHLIGIHNGICVNDKEVWKKVKKLKPTSELDSESVLAFMDERYQEDKNWPKAVQQTFHILEGSASLAILSTTSPHLTLATNTGSIYFLHFKNELFLFASEHYILSQIQKKFPELQPTKILQLHSNTGLVVDLPTAKINNFPFDKKITQASKAAQDTKTPITQYESKNSVPSVSSLFMNDLKKIQAHTIDFKRIKKLKRCTKCILPSTMPLIDFDAEGVCNYCRNYQPISYKGKASLEELVAPYRKNTGEPDCIMAFSGGRDSSYGLHYVKNVLNMNPIAYTYDWGMITDTGRRNQARMVGKLGVEHMLVSADINKKRKNIRANILAWIKKPDLGMVPLFMAGDKQAEYYAQQLQKKNTIELVIYCRGNELENEEFKWGYCGIKNGSPNGVLHDLSLKGKVQLASYYGKNYFLNPSYFNQSLVDTLFAYFVAYVMPLNFVYLWHYIPWDEDEIISTLRKEYDWEVSPENGVTWRIDDGSVAFYNYIFYRIQGFTENDTFRSNQIREGMMTRNEALKLVEKENEPRYQSLKWYFDQLELDGDQVLSAIDSVPTLY